MKTIRILFLNCLLLSACVQSIAASNREVLPENPTSEPTQANIPNPASAFCEGQGNRLEIRTAADGSQAGVCIFPDGSECDEWAYYRGECLPAAQDNPTYTPSVEVDAITPTPTSFPTLVPFDAADYQGWWTYTHAVYGYTVMLPEDWIVEETTTNDPLMNGHMLSLHPKEIAPGLTVEQANIRMTFRRQGEEARLWPTGVGQGEFVPQGTLDVAGQPAQRVLLVCPSGEVTAIWYHQGERQPNIVRGDLEFGFIFSAGDHCEAGYSLSGKVQRLGEMIIASLKAP